MTRKRKIPSSSNCKWYNCCINILKLQWKQNNLLHSKWQISLKNKENLLFLLCMNLEKIKNDDQFYFSKNINYTWLKRGTFKLSQDQNDILIRYLVPEIERLEYESLSKVVYQTSPFALFWASYMNEILTAPGFPYGSKRKLSHCNIKVEVNTPNPFQTNLSVKDDIDNIWMKNFELNTLKLE